MLVVASGGLTTFAGACGGFTGSSDSPSVDGPDGSAALADGGDSDGVIADAGPEASSDAAEDARVVVPVQFVGATFADGSGGVNSITLDMPPDVKLNDYMIIAVTEQHVPPGAALPGWKVISQRGSDGEFMSTTVLGRWVDADVGPGPFTVNLGRVNKVLTSAVLSVYRGVNEELREVPPVAASLELVEATVLTAPILANPPAKSRVVYIYSRPKVGTTWTGGSGLTERRATKYIALYDLLLVEYDAGTFVGPSTMRTPQATTIVQALFLPPK